MPARNGNYDLVKDWIRENGTMPNGDKMPKRKMARMIYKEHGLNFTDEENVRIIIQRVTGKGGKNDEVRVDADLKDDLPANYNPYGLPESHTEEKIIFKLPVGCTRVLYLPDPHIPYHDVDAMTVAINTGKEKKINCIILPGDVIDMHQGSKYESNPKKRSIKEEFDAACEFLQILRDTFPGVPIYWIEGNHDKRWRDFLLRKCREIWDDPYYHLEDRLKLADKNITLFNEKVEFWAGDLRVTHGHLIFNTGFGAPIYPAKSMWDKTGVQYVIGHVHTVTTYKKVRKGAPNQMCYTLGCLSEIDPDYNPIVNRYEHGFGYQDIYPDGTFDFYNYRIENGRAKL